jgi:hypothetical protein
MSTESNLLLSNITTLGSFTSDKLPGAGYHGFDNGIHTFSITLHSWSGELRLQGTLALYPNEDTDWVNLRDLSDTSIVLGDGSSDYDDTTIVNSLGKFVWIRAVGSVTAGEITEIRYNY